MNQQWALIRELAARIPYKSSGFGIQPMVVGMLLYSLLIQQIPLGLLPAISVDPPRQQPPLPTIQLQYTHAQHVVGFGTSQVVLGSRTHSLTLTLSHAQRVTPIERIQNQSKPDDPLSLSNAPDNVSIKNQAWHNPVIYENPWPGVTVSYQPQAGSIIKSEYQLTPGFTAETIARIRIGYNRPIVLDTNGRIKIQFSLGEMIESAPLAWQDIRGVRKAVRVKFCKTGPQEAGFKVEMYDNRYPLVIDPSLTWNSYLSRKESDYDSGQSMAVDTNGNTYLTGFSNGSWGTPVRPYYKSLLDAFVVKLDASGNIVWNTFLGGSAQDFGYTITVDGTGNLYVAGKSYATWGAPISPQAHPKYTFVAKLNNNGNLLWNTFVGGDSLDAFPTFSIAVDGSGTVYLTTASGSTWGTPLQAHIGGMDVEVVKLDNNGDLLWNTFLGGTGVDNGRGIAVDSGGNIYVTGDSAVAWGSPVRAYTGGMDAFAAKLDTSGNLLWNTFLGAAGDDYGNSIAVDGGGNVWVGGMGNATWGSPVRAYSGNYDVFVVQLDNVGNLIWNTFLGSAGNNHCYMLALDGAGNVYVSGDSGTWAGAVRAYSSGWDAFAAKLDTSGNLLWHTFLGGGKDDRGYALAADTNYVYIGGYSMTGWGSPTRAYAGGSDAFASKVDANGNLIWNTFLGGAGEEQGNGIAMDSNGNIYINGYCNATWGTPLRAFSNGTYDTFVAKMDPAGSIIWNTFLGGAGNDYGTAITLDASQNIYIAGYSSATWGSPMRSYSSGTDAFAAKLSNNGTLLWNTFLGGGGTDNGYGIAVEGSGNVFVTGDDTATWGSPVQGYGGGGTDAFVAELDNNGGMVWNTFLGGTGYDTGKAITVNGSGNAYICGYSDAAWGSPVRGYNGSYDAFAAKLTNSGGLQWNTFLGGTGVEIGTAMTLDSSNNVYVAGRSSGASWGTPKRAYVGSFDAFAVKLDNTGALLWNTFLGGGNMDLSNGILVDGTGIV